MPSSPNVGDRTWFGIARPSEHGIVLEGALGPWTREYDLAQILLSPDQGAMEWMSLGQADMEASDLLFRLEARTPKRGTQRTANSLPGDLCVAICSRERPGSLRECLERFRSHPSHPSEILVVDNAPQSNATESVVNDMAAMGLNVRRVVEPLPGLARARNLALRSTDAEFVAFTDDDARPDRSWSRQLHSGFSAGSNVAVVTGLVPPATIETPAQALMEKKLKWSTNLVPETFDLAAEKVYPWPFPYSAGHLGAGANFAMRRAAGLELGGFDEALGAGTRTESGEDNEMFVRILRGGFQLRYEPSAIVWHLHRREDRELRRLLFGYGKGLSAAAVREFMEPGKMHMLLGTWRGARNLLKDRQTEMDYGMPRSHLALEVAGVALGPLAYVAERYLGPRRVRPT
jgi:GT2 family glycosyltransferase